MDWIQNLGWGGIKADSLLRDLSNWVVAGAIHQDGEG